MERKWFHRPYVYGNGVVYNKARREVFVCTEDGTEVSVGGAFTVGADQVIAFVCPREDQRKINNLDDVMRVTEGRYVFGGTLMGALRTLKWKYPIPDATLAEVAAVAMASF